MDTAPTPPTEPTPTPPSEPTPAPATPPAPEGLAQPSAPPEEPKPAAAPPAPPAVPAPSPTPSRRGKIYHPRPEKRTWTPYVFGVVLLALFAGLLYVRTLDLPWEEFKHQEGGFSVNFPEKPEIKTKLIPGEGEKLVYQEMMFRTGWEDEFYAAGFVDVPKEPERESLERVFSELVRGHLAEIGDSDPTAKLLETKPWSHEGLPGRVARYSVRNGTCTLETRWVIAGKRVYVLRTGVHGHREGLNDAKFFGSFRILKK